MDEIVTPRKGLASALDGAAVQQAPATPVVAPLEDAAAALRSFGLQRLDKGNSDDE